MRFARPCLAALFALASVSATAHAEPPPSAPAVAPVGAVPWLGVAMDKGGDLGVRVDTVVRGSPAERSGLHAGDRIVAVDGARVTTPAEVSRTVASHKVGETLSLGLERGGSPIAVSVVLAARPSSESLLRMHLVGAPAPAWSNVSPLSGAPASVAALQGKVVVLDFWASWCGPCRALAPRLSTLRDRFGAQGLAVVGLTTDPAEDAALFAQQHAMRYPIVVDAGGDTSRAYNITALPTIVLVDKKGIVRDVVVGYAPDEVEAAVKKLLAEPGPAPRR